MQAKMTSGLMGLPVGASTAAQAITIRLQVRALGGVSVLNFCSGESRQVCPLARFDPKEGSILVILLLDRTASNLQTSMPKTLQCCFLAAMPKEHRRSQPFADPFSRLAGSKARDQCAARLEPRGGARKPLPL